ncbi:hypothetical protein PR001_g32771, partial [Phytophthora rubi]
MHLKTRTTGNKFVGIDALEKGGLLRLMNHSCNAAARFHEVQTGDKLTVVAVTVRDVFPGEEMTVSYGSKLWFLCRTFRRPQATSTGFASHLRIMVQRGRRAGYHNYSVKEQMLLCTVAA